MAAVWRRIQMAMNGTTPARRMQEEADVGVAAVIMCYRNLMLQEKNANREKADVFDEAVQTIEKKKFEAQKQFVQENSTAQVKTMFDAMLHAPVRDLDAKNRPNMSISGFERPSTAAKAEEQDDFIQKTLGFSLTVRPSSIPDAGNGVFLNGHARIGSVLALYPGIVYLPEHFKKPEHLRELSGNPYARARFDSVIIDAKRVPPTPPHNPMAVAHMINHPHPETTPNVIPFAFDFPPDEPFTDETYQALIPNSFVEQPSRLAMFGKRALVHGLAFIASADIEDGEELFLNYRYNPNQELPEWYTPVDLETDQAMWK